jgi:YegS/Rv2252/BmrU family lipid kinase
MLKLAFIVHGKSKRKKHLLKEIQMLFSEDKFQTKVFETSYFQHAIFLAERIANEGFTHIIACGGDGTLNEVLNGIIKSGNKNIKLGLLPRGSGNDFIKTIQSPKLLSEIKMLITQNTSKKIDIGFAEFVSKEGQEQYQFFINITDVGIGGVIAQQLFESKKIFGSTITYQYFIIKNLLSYKPKVIKVKGDNFTYSGKIMNFCAANAKYFGSGLGVAPDANLSDGVLNAIALGDVGLIDYFKNFLNLKRCKPLNHPAIEYFTTKELYFESETPNMPIDMDGEFIGFLPMKISVKPHFIDFIA